MTGPMPMMLLAQTAAGIVSVQTAKTRLIWHSNTPLWLNSHCKTPCGSPVFTREEIWFPKALRLPWFW